MHQLADQDGAARRGLRLDETMAEDSEAGAPAVAEGAEKSLATDAPDAPAAKRQKTDAEPGQAAAEEAPADDSAAAAAAAVTAGADAGAAADEAAGSSEGKKSGKEKASKDDEEGGAGSLAIPKNAVKRIMKLEDDVKQVGGGDVPWTLGVCCSVSTKDDPSRAAAAAARPLGSLFTITGPALRLSPLLFPTPGPSGGGPPRGQGDRAFPREIRARLPQVRRAAGPQAGQIQ